MGMCPCHRGVPNARHASPWPGCAFHHGGISLPLPVQGQHLAFPAVALWVTVALAVCVVGLLAVLVYVCQKKIRQSFEEEEENAGNVAGNPLERDGVCRERWGGWRAMDGEQPEQILTGADLPWWWHFLKDEGMLGATGVGGHQQIVLESSWRAACIAPGGPFKHTSGFLPTQCISPFHLPALSILCLSGTHTWIRMEHLVR